MRIMLRHVACAFFFSLDATPDVDDLPLFNLNATPLCFPARSLVRFVSVFVETGFVNLNF